MRQGPSVEGLLVARFQLQSRITVLLGLLEPTQLQEANGSAGVSAAAAADATRVVNGSMVMWQ